MFSWRRVASYSSLSFITVDYVQLSFFMTDTMVWYVVYKYIMTLYYLGYVLRVASYSCLSFITVDYVQLSFL